MFLNALPLLTHSILLIALLFRLYRCGDWGPEKWRNVPASGEPGRGYRGWIVGHRGWIVTLISRRLSVSSLHPLCFTWPGLFLHIEMREEWKYHFKSFSETGMWSRSLWPRNAVQVSEKLCFPKHCAVREVENVCIARDVLCRVSYHPSLPVQTWPLWKLGLWWALLPVRVSPKHMYCLVPPTQGCCL